MKIHLIILSILCFIYSFTLNAQWNDKGVAVMDTSGGYGYPKMVPDGRRGCYVIWMDARNGMGYGIFVQRLDSSGREVFQHNGIPVVSTENYPQLNLCTADGKGGIFFTWFDQRDSPHGYIYAQYMDSSGKMRWQTNGVKVSDVEGLSGQVVVDGTGGCIINFTTDYDMVMQRLDSAGNRLWGGSGILQTNNKGFINYCHSASDGNGGIIVSWTIADSAIYAQRIRHDGSVAWKQNGIRLSNVDTTRANTHITSDGYFGAIVSWTNGSNVEVRAQRVDSNGTLLWGNNGIHVGYSGSGVTLLISDQKGGAIIPTFNKLYRVNSSGIHLWPDGIVFLQNGDWPWLVSDSASGAIIVYNSDGDTSITDMLAKRIDSNGVLQWTLNGVALSSHKNSYKTHAVAVADGKGGVIAAWDDFQLHGTYVGRVNDEGRVVTGVVQKINPLIPDVIQLYQNFPNPFNPETIIRYQIPVKSNVKLIVYDILGREIAMLINEKKEAGEYSVRFDGEKYSTGIYFYRFTVGTQTITKKMVIIH